MSETISLEERMATQGGFQKSHKRTVASPVTITKCDSNSSLAKYISGEASYNDTFRADDDDIQWITVKGTHIPLKDGKAVGGPKELRGKTFGSAESNNTQSQQSSQNSSEPTVLRAITKGKANDRISKLYDQVNKHYEETGAYDDEKWAAAAKEIEEILKQLPPGSVIREDYGYEVEFWEVQKDGLIRFKHSGNYYRPEDLATSFLVPEEERPKIVNVAWTEEQKRAYKQKQKASYWKNQKQIWANFDTPLDEKTHIQLRYDDLKNVGLETEVTMSDGTVIVKGYDGWYNKETYRRVPANKIGNPTIEADFFTTAFGLNGLSHDECSKVRQQYYGMDEKVRNAYDTMFRNIPVMSGDNTTGTCYDTRSQTVILKAQGAECHAILHEFGHAIDANVPIKDREYKDPDDGEFKHREFYSIAEYIDMVSGGFDGVVSDFETMASILGYKTDGSGGFADGWEDPFMEEKLEPYNNLARKYRKNEGFECVSDVISGLAFGKLLCIYGGHSADYWMSSRFGYGYRDAGSLHSKEMWTEYLELKATHNNEMLDLMSKISPKRYEACEKAYEEFIIKEDI